MSHSTSEVFDRLREARMKRLLERLFAGPRLKLDRARSHIENLRDQPNVRDAHGGITIHGEPRATSDGRVWRLWVDAQHDPNISPDIPLIIGDAVHNLRGALDHLAWKIVELDNGVPGRNTYFPVASDTAQLNRKIRKTFGERPETHNLLQSIDACPRGAGHLLFHLHSISNVDKHRMLMPLASASEIEGIVLINLSTKERLPRAPIRTLPSKESNRRVLDVPEDWGIDATLPMTATFNMYFAEPGLQEKPLVETLVDIDRQVDRAISASERWFREFRYADYRANNRIRHAVHSGKDEGGFDD